MRQTTIKSIYKGGNKANISESQRGIFLINIIPKVYELVKITQNEKNNSKMSEMQAAGRKERSAMDNLIIMNTIIENQRAQKLNTYMFFADAVKCFDKLWLKDCLLEMYNLGYDPNTLKILYEMNKETDVIIKTPVGNTDNIQVKEVVKQGTIFGPIMCCAETSTVNSIGEEVKYRYGKINIGMPVFMDDIATAGKAEHIRKGISNCARMEREKKISFGLKKTKYMIVKTGREEEEEINETVKAGRIQRTDKCKYLGITISTDGQLTEHIKELNTRCDIINREICAIGAKTQVGKEEVRVKLKLFETCLMPALLYGMEAWKKLTKAEVQQLEKIQGKALKRIFSLPITTPYIGLIIETGAWPAEQRINYKSLMLYHNIINSSKDRLVKQIVQEQRAQNHQNTFYGKVRTIAEELNIKLEAAVAMKKSEWKRTIKDKIQNKIQERVEKEMENKTKLRTVREDKWERKEYIAKCDSDLVKDIIKIRLHMWELKRNYPREEEDMKYPICNQKEDTTEHVLECQTAETVYRISDNTPNQWTEVVKLYRQNKELRK